MTPKNLGLLAGLMLFVTAVVVAFSDPAEDARFFDPSSEEDLARIRLDGAEVSVSDAAGKEVLQLDFGHEKQYPTVHLDAPAGGWDLSAYAGVEATVTNRGEATVNIALRVDNAGEWKDQPWNIEHTSLPAGQTKTLQVTFGRSWGAPSFDLDAAKVIGVALYVENPKADSTVLVTGLDAFGEAPPPRETVEVDLDGELVTFDEGFDSEEGLERRGASAKLEDGRLVVSFGTEEQWPAVYLFPPGKRWDLTNFESIEMEVTNRSDAGVRVLARVDNPNPDGHRNCNTNAAQLEAGETKTLKVTFGKSWGGQGFDLDPSNVVGILLMVDNPKQPYTLAVGNIKANPKEYAELPEWLGTRPPVEGDWVATLDESFEGDELDQERWTPRLCWDGPAKGELQRYLEGNVTVEEGALKIKCEKSPGHQYDNPELDTREYATGAVTSLDKWTQAYGYFEARIKRPTTRGLWPAFWMMPDRGPEAGDIWQRRTTDNGGMEIDIWEHLCEWGAGRYNAATHWDGYGDDHQSWGTSDLQHLPTEDGWHAYGLLWEPGKLTWFCDGKEMVTWENERVTEVPLYIKFTVQMGNWATKDVDDASLPDFLQVDYVRAWQLRERTDAAP